MKPGPTEARAPTEALSAADDPVFGWLRARDTPAFDDADAAGARAVVRLQTALSAGAIMPEARGEPCLFVQVQHVERGGAVGPHVDPLD